MDLLAYVIVMLVYAAPFVICGAVVFLLCTPLVFGLSRLKPPQSPARQKIVKVGLVASLVIGAISSVPLFVYYLNQGLNEVRPEDEAMLRLKQELLRDGRDQAWPAGTITDLEKWVDRNGGEFTPAMRLRVASTISDKIDANQLATNDADFTVVEALANHPHALDSYSDFLVASNVAYVHLSKNGFGDMGHPENFKRAPGHNTFANQIDYATYIKVAMVRCTQQPDLAGCRDVFTEATVNEYDTREDKLFPLNWYEKEHVVTPLRAALGYAPKKDAPH